MSWTGSRNGGGDGVGAQRGASVSRGLFGFRPGRSPLDAVAVCRERCFKKEWVVDVDIRAFFDYVPWDLTLEALARHTDREWVVMYVERWLKAPMLMDDGSLAPREKGTPQGSPISPLIANLFLHYTFDNWMDAGVPGHPVERFADDVVIHCVSETSSQFCAQDARSSAGRGRVGASPGEDQDGVLQEQQTPGNIRARLVHVLRLRVRPRKAKNKSQGGDLHWLPPGRLSGEAERNEPPDSVMAAPSAGEPDP